MYNKLSKNILVVEDSVMFTRILKRSVEAVDGFKVIAVETFADLKKLLEANDMSFLPVYLMLIYPMPLMVKSLITCLHIIFPLLFLPVS
ncbi:hypothetical protein [Psychromonas sp. Urea-02u-13]|uniref:hypothetical protein n=1 Tax=Psychromonas sp. Urea-02u-13 TaxID=2058326 RepID=UPI000C339EC5|nr:hypothetical protein [Psychromonas sp. Urea-02u-13]PKG38259.1 hypothetical protein CXF74_14605 [Psychromonas sp. Urea-02u-13]